MGSHPRAQVDDVTALLRPAAESDLTDIVRIERSCFADPWSEESFRRLLAVESAIFLVAVFPPDSAVAGYAIAFAVGEDGELLNVAVEPEFRGKGLAGQMVDALLIELSAGGVRTEEGVLPPSGRGCAGDAKGSGSRRGGRAFGGNFC